jgi:hypothetical protein
VREREEYLIQNTLIAPLRKHFVPFFPTVLLYLSLLTYFDEYGYTVNALILHMCVCVGESEHECFPRAEGGVCGGHGETP